MGWAAMTRRIALGLLLLCSLAACIRADDDADEKDVVVLTDKNFDEKLGSVKYALVRGARRPLCRL